MLHAFNRINRGFSCFTMFFRVSSNFRKHGKPRKNTASHGEPCPVDIVYTIYMRVVDIP